MNQQKIDAAIELLSSTRRNLNLVDEHLKALNDGRIPMETASDVSTEHRFAMFSALDANDQKPGILLGSVREAASFGFANPYNGIIRVQEDAAFVCTNIVVAVSLPTQITIEPPEEAYRFSENAGVIVDDQNAQVVVPYLRLRDANTGRSLITGLTEAPLDRDRGAIPFTYMASFRPGLGSNIKSQFFAEFTIPRAGVVRAEVFNMGQSPGRDSDAFGRPRAYVSLIGYKVYGA